MADRCYVPRFHAMPADEVRGSVDEVGTAQLGDRLVGHLAHADPALAVDQGRVARSRRGPGAGRLPEAVLLRQQA